MATPPFTPPSSTNYLNPFLLPHNPAKVNYYASYAPGGSGRALASRAIEIFEDRGIVVHDRWKPQDGQTTEDDQAAAKILSSKVFFVFLDELWLRQPQCEYDYNIAQLQNLTGSRPIIFPVFCQDFTTLKENPLLQAVRTNLSIHAFPRLEFWRDPAAEGELLQQVCQILETVLMKHLPDLPRSPECEEHEAKTAKRLSQIMTIMNESQRNGLHEEMPSGKWVGVMIGTGRNKLRPRAKSRWPMESYIRFADDDPTSFCGHGRDDVGFFLLKGNLKEERRKVEFYFVYIDVQGEAKALHTLSFSGGCQGVCMTGRWSLHHRSKTEAPPPSMEIGYWAMWPESFISLELLDKCLRKHSAKFQKLIPCSEQSEEVERERVFSEASEVDISDCESVGLNSSLDDSFVSSSFVYDETRPPIQNMSSETAAAVSDIMTQLDEQMEELPPQVADLVRRLSLVLTSPPGTPMTSPTSTPLPAASEPPDFGGRKN